ncbi:hypothetical protein AJ80_06329 [Polytolypa hystricis UAMH7299]|uniref:37S ribosomal protein Rsm22 n=1 Tax=Polytolypa hystricis (strain UAMH7299) TaxID=1447883 RepID=A0A2B7XWS9_POLH7|nr:hypothetical protein AJ80_06329 [Polytolypa hystricis UAMH7299]
MLSGHSGVKLCASGSQDLLHTLRHARSNRPYTQLLRQTRSSPITHRHLSSLSPASSTLQRPSKKLLRRHHVEKRLLSASPTLAQDATRKDAVFDLVDKIHKQEAEIVKGLEDLELTEDFPDLVYSEDLDLVELISPIVGYRNLNELESRVRLARHEHGQSLPAEELNEEELELYKRLYGEPLARHETTAVEAEEEQSDQLFRDDGEGGLVEVEVDELEDADAMSDAERLEEAMSEVEAEQQSEEEEYEALMERHRRVAQMFGAVGPMEPPPADDIEEGSTIRTHPNTTIGRSTPSDIIHIPSESLTKPVAIILSSYPKKHVAAAAEKLFGGPGLPYSTSLTPKGKQQLPIPLQAGQQRMSNLEANVFISTLYPGMYASTLSVLIELRKRLGQKWLRDLMCKDGGPRVLDAGAGGAGIIAWREILRAEFALMSPDHPSTSPIPMGKSTVLAGSDPLRHRAAALLENTTFLPRLPDYIHLRDGPTMEDDRPAPKRKQFDVIIAPHTIFPIADDYMRKEHVENLWELLNPDGGVLILLEKGVPRGFEAIAGARQMILDNLISSPGSTEYENLLQSPDGERFVKKERGMILAPCTNHSRCPMYTSHGEATARKDYCHFGQRYARPQFQRRMYGEKANPQENVKFSYLAVQRGVDLRESREILQGEAATEAAFQGYDTTTEHEGKAEDQKEMEPFALPRIVFPSLKRKGHVTMDLCTPGGKIERWTIPRSFSKQAYRDARKSEWGDLWALGAKTRQPRNLKLGQTAEDSGDIKRDRRVRRANNRQDSDEAAEQAGEEFDLEGEGVDVPHFSRTMSKFDQAQGKKPPAWVKRMETRKVRKQLNSKKNQLTQGGV